MLFVDGAITVFIELPPDPEIVPPTSEPIVQANPLALETAIEAITCLSFCEPPCEEPQTM